MTNENEDQDNWNDWLDENGSPLNDEEDYEWVEVAGQLIPRRELDESEEEIRKQKMRNYSWF